MFWILDFGFCERQRCTKLHLTLFELLWQGYSGLWISDRPNIVFKPEHRLRANATQTVNTRILEDPG